MAMPRARAHETSNILFYFTFGVVSHVVLKSPGAHRKFLSNWLGSMQGSEDVVLFKICICGTETICAILAVFRDFRTVTSNAQGPHSAGNQI